MKTGILTAALLAPLLTAGASQAQQVATPAPSPLDVVPDKMPFSEPYGAPITLEHAKHLIAAVQAEAKKRGWAMNISVVDPGGNLVAFERMDGAQLASISISEDKARAAVMYRRPTKVFEEAIQ
jgi:glc operon protein GlcG